MLREVETSLRDKAMAWHVLRMQRSLCHAPGITIRRLAQPSAQNLGAATPRSITG